VKVTVSVGSSWTAGSAHSVTGVPHAFSIEGYTGNIEVAYTDGWTVKSIKLTGNGKEYLIGRVVDANHLIRLKFDASGDLLFRDAVNGFIPIGSYAEFRMISGNAQNKYRLEADLDLMDVGWTPIVVTGQTYFNGEFDGAGKKISNLRITGSGSNRSLFSRNRGTIRNVHIVSGTITGTGYIGGICGANELGGQIISCSNAANVSGTSMVGGVSGDNSGTVTACYNTGTVKGTQYVGGVAGGNLGTVTACYNTGSVSGTQYVGGVSGDNAAASTVTACYNTGSVSRSSGTSTDFGSMTGYNPGTVTACYWKSGTVFTSKGIGYGTDTTAPFTDYFTPSGNAAWGIGNGSGTNRWWKAGINYTNTLPKLWFE
jgi:hypothetical protein